MTSGRRSGAARDGRALSTRREWGGEVLREVLRLARRREYDDQHGGFVVEGTDGDSDEPFGVACLTSPGEGLDVAEELRGYRQAFHQCGYQVGEHPEDPNALRITFR